MKLLILDWISTNQRAFQKAILPLQLLCVLFHILQLCGCFLQPFSRRLLRTAPCKRWYTYVPTYIHAYFQIRTCDTARTCDIPLQLLIEAPLLIRNTAMLPYGYRSSRSVEQFNLLSSLHTGKHGRGAKRKEGLEYLIINHHTIRLEIGKNWIYNEICISIIVLIIIL